MSKLYQASSKPNRPTKPSRASTARDDQVRGNVFVDWDGLGVTTAAVGLSAGVEVGVGVGVDVGSV